VHWAALNIYIYINRHTHHTMSNDESSKTEIETTDVKMDESSKDAPEEEPQPVESNEASEMADDVEEKEDEEETARKAEEERKKKEELKKKYANWPLRNIKDPHDNDIMYGRGGGTNHHPGNKMYRTLVEDRKLEYVNSKRLDKPLVALEIIRLWRGQLPPGRFLKLEEKTGLWNDVGDKKAREKTSQALREKAPLIRKQQEDEKSEEEGSSDVSVLGNFLLECQVLFLMTFGC
jgi:DNA mismatch repair ATPase MutL